MRTYFITLGLTIAIECPIVWLMTRRQGGRNILFLALFLNLVSHPLGTVLIEEKQLSWTTVEIGVAVFEALGYGALGRLIWTRALAVALVANLVTGALSFVF